MTATSGSAIENIIKNYIETKERSLGLTKKRNDLEKEYNKLLTLYGGEDKNFNLEQADKIYEAYQEMIVTGEEAKIAEARFSETEEKLNELGAILFEATINAEISMTPVNGDLPAKRPVRVAYYNGQVIVS
jgi:hypothetical protein